MAPPFASLNDTNYAEWRMFMQALLTRQGVWGVVSGEITRPQGSDNSTVVKSWRKKNDTGLAEIILMLSPSQLGLVQGITDAHTCWTHLETAHRSRGFGTRLSLRRDLFTMSKLEEQTMTSWIADVRQVAFQLTDIGATVADEDIIIVLTKGLPSSYDQLVVSLDSIPTDDLTLDLVIRRLVNEESRQAQSSLSLSSSALHARPSSSSTATRRGAQPRGRVPLSEITCYNCGLKGHYQQQCTAPLKSFRERASIAVASSSIPASATLASQPGTTLEDYTFWPDSSSV